MNAIARNTFLRIIILTIILFFIVVFVSLRLKQNSIEAETVKLQAKIDAAQDEINELQAELDKPFDAEYVAKVAREKLGLRYPHEIVFYGSGGKGGN